MKLTISFNLLNLKEALSLAKQVEQHCNAFEVGSLLITQYGMEALTQFRKKFPEKVIFADTKIVEHEKEMVTLAKEAGCNWVTVLAGADNNIIHNTCNIAHQKGVKVLLDLIDSNSFGQNALEAERLGADAILFHKITDENSPHIFLDQWDMVKGNTNLPVYIAAHTTRENIHEIMKNNPEGIVIGYAITHAENPKEEALYFYNLINKN